MFRLDIVDEKKIKKLQKNGRKKLNSKLKNLKNDLICFSVNDCSEVLKLYLVVPRDIISVVVFV